MATDNLSDAPVRGTRVVYDTAATTPIIGADTNHSILIARPAIIQFDTIPSLTTVQVQQKIHADATWVNVGAAIGNSDGAKIIPFTDPVPNFVQLVRTGTGAVKAYSQGR